MDSMSESGVSLSRRGEAVLRAVVEEYIACSTPVGSLRVCDLENLDVSSATVRKEMVMLEEIGYLKQPHVSAGRVPTVAGYRYFVDCLMEPLELSEETSKKVSELFQNASGELASFLVSLSSFLSEITDCTSVVVAPNSAVSTVCSVQLVELSSRVVLVVAVLSTGAVERRALELSKPIDSEELLVASEVLTSALFSLPLTSKVTFRAPSEKTQVLAENAAAALQASPSGFGLPIFVGGQAALATAFVDSAVTVRMLDLFDHRGILLAVLQDIVDRGLEVAIGREVGLDPPAECSVVVSPYEVDGQLAGSLAVIGPTNMNYQSNLAAVSTMSSQLSRLLSSD